MTDTATERVERRKPTHHQIMAFLRSGPREPLATREQVLEIACTNPGCGADAGRPCDTRQPHSAWAAGMVLKGMRGVHLRRYLDRTHDPR